MKKNTKVSFETIPVGNYFHYNGADWIKRSTRTAKLYGRPSRWFYFNKTDMVKLIPAKHNPAYLEQPLR